MAPFFLSSIAQQMLHTPIPAFPCEWLLRQASHLARGARTLDLAGGAGRNARWLAANGMRVVIADRDAQALSGLHAVPGIETVTCDLENGPWPWPDAAFDAVVVTHYLYRPRWPELVGCLKPGGILIYRTFMTGQERFGRPSRPAFLLQPDELFDWARQWGCVLAFEQGEVTVPRPACMQAVVVRKAGG